DELLAIIRHEDNGAAPTGVKADANGVMTIRALEVKQVANLVGADRTGWRRRRAEHRQRDERHERDESKRHVGSLSEELGPFLQATPLLARRAGNRADPYNACECVLGIGTGRAHAPR